MFYTEFIQPYRISEEIMSGLSKEERRARVVDVLNEARAMELFAITQYMNQHYGLDAMDYGELAAKMKLIAIDEMRHAEMFAERVKELGGEPVTSYEGDLKKGQDVRSIFPYDTQLEDDTIDVYSQFLLTCRDNGDPISAKLFETIIEEEQAHMNYFDNVGNHIATLGDTYLSKIAGTSASTGPTTKGFVIGGGN
jgi:bacterioferritin